MNTICTVALLTVLVLGIFWARCILRLVNDLRTRYGENWDTLIRDLRETRQMNRELASRVDYWRDEYQAMRQRIETLEEMADNGASFWKAHDAHGERITTLEGMASSGQKFWDALAEVRARVDQHRDTINSSNDINDNRFREARERVMALEKRVGEYVADLTKKINNERDARVRPISGLDARIAALSEFRHTMEGWRRNVEEKQISLAGRIDSETRRLRETVECQKTTDDLLRKDFNRMQEQLAELVDGKADHAEIKEALAAVVGRVDLLSAGVAKAQNDTALLTTHLFNLQKSIIMEDDKAPQAFADVPRAGGKLFSEQKRDAEEKIGNAVLRQIPLSPSDKASVEQMAKVRPDIARQLGSAVMGRMNPIDARMTPEQLADRFLGGCDPQDLFKAIREATSL